MNLPKPEDFTPLIRKLPERVFSTSDKQITEYDLSADQKEVFDRMVIRCRSLNPYERVSLAGYAGTGKSTLIPLLAESVGSVHRTAFVSFTGKAANVLKRKLEVAGIPGNRAGFIGTIHSLIYSPEVDSRGIVQRWQRKPKLLNSDEAPLDLIIIDEASMVNEKLLSDLSSYGIPIILVGDHGQLPPVEGESILHKPDFRLEKIHRQAAENPIIKFSQEIRETGGLPAFEDCEEIRNVTMKELGPVLEDGFERLQLDMGLLVRSNKKRTMLNQQAVGGAKIPRPGDILICLRNNPPIFNGMRGILVSAEPVHDHWFKARIDFPDDGISLTTLINRHQFNQPKTISSIYELYEDFGYPRSVSDIGMLFDYGMAMTVHKAQGSAFESAVLWSEYWPSYDDGSDFFARWLYTGVTRAAKTLYLLR